MGRSRDSARPPAERSRNLRDLARGGRAICATAHGAVARFARPLAGRSRELRDRAPQVPHVMIFVMNIFKTGVCGCGRAIARPPPTYIMYTYISNIYMDSCRHGAVARLCATACGAVAQFARPPARCGRAMCATARGAVAILHARPPATHTNIVYIKAA